MNDQEKIDMGIRQRRGLTECINGRFSNVPYYIQDLSIRLEAIEYKVNMILEIIKRTDD